MLRGVGEGYTRSCAAGWLLVAVPLMLLPQAFDGGPHYESYGYMKGYMACTVGSCELSHYSRRVYGGWVMWRDPGREGRWCDICMVPDGAIKTELQEVGCTDDTPSCLVTYRRTLLPCQSL